MLGKPVAAVLFRFAVLYLGLFSLATQISGSLLLFPGWSFRGFGALWPMRSVTTWVATGILGVEPPLDFTGTNGETVAFWVQTAWILLAAILGTLGWTLAAGGRGDYARAHEWFRLFVRLALAGQMFEYGVTKIIPNQFEAPALTVLVTPSGDLPLNTLFWTVIGSSQGYQMVTGWAELAAGILLIFPRTVLLGALVALVDVLHVLALNMAFDIGLKLTALHLVVLALALLAPDLGRLSRFFFANRGVDAPFRERQSGVLRRPAFRNVIVVFGAYLVAMQVWANITYWYEEGGGATSSALYGIWDVERMSVSGVSGPVESNDYDRRWRRLIFDEAGTMAIQRTDDSFARFRATIDESDGALRLFRTASPSWTATFRFSRDGRDRISIDGTMDGIPIDAVLVRRAEDTFRLLNSRFRWIRPDAD